MTSKLARAAAAVVLALVLAGAGCARIPVEGPVQTEPQRTRGPEQPIDIIPHPPEPGDGPDAIVQGFLHAMVEGHGDYSVARSYLSDAAADRWQPGDQAVIYTTASARWTITPTSAVLEAEAFGRLDRHGAFTRVQDPYRIDFGLVQEKGQWRVSNPPAGLLLMQDLYEHTFVAATSYFFDPSYRVLVPEVVHVPKLKRTPTFLVAQLVAGPSEWLRPAVRSALPSGTSLAGEVSVTTDGIATVPLAGELASLDTTARGLLAAQLAVTLGQAGGQVIGGVRVLANGSPYVLPQADSSGVVPVAQYSRYLATNLQSSGQVFGVRDDRVVLVTETTAGAVVEPVPGPLSRPGRRIDRIAVALDSSRLALVTEESSRLLLASPVGDAEPTLALSAPGLLSPQFSRFGEVWTMSVTPSGTVVHRLDENGTDAVVEAPELADLVVTAFRLSPDGMRMAVVTAKGSESQLHLLRVRRGDTVGLHGLRTLRASWAPSGPATIVGLGWRSDHELTLLGSEAGKAEVNPYELDQDAATVRRTSTQTWDAVRLQTSPYNTRYMALALGPSGQVWRRGEDASWRRWASELQAVGVAG